MPGAERALWLMDGARAAKIVPANKTNQGENVEAGIKKKPMAEPCGEPHE